jgi:hypothetical protein
VTARPDPADNRRFVRRLPVAAIVALVVWILLRSTLDGAVSGFAQLLIRAYEYPKVTRLVVVDHRAEVRRADMRTDSVVPTVALTEIHFNTIVFLALCLALPRPWSRKQLERLVMGWSVLYLTQSLNLLFHVKFLYASAFGAWSLQQYSTVARNVFGFLQYATDLPGRFAFPFAIWIGLSLYWLATPFKRTKSGAGAESKSESKSAPKSEPKASDSKKADGGKSE